jgi:hypothetical protein
MFTLVAVLRDSLHGIASVAQQQLLNMLRISTCYTKAAAGYSNWLRSAHSQQDTNLCCCWLQLIAFYFTYLLEDLHPGLASSVCLMPPGSSFLLLNSGVLDLRPQHMHVGLST